MHTPSTSHAGRRGRPMMLAIVVGFLILIAGGLLGSTLLAGFGREGSSDRIRTSRRQSRSLRSSPCRAG